MIDIGTRVKLTKDVWDAATGDCPLMVWGMKGEAGVVVSRNEFWEFYIKLDGRDEAFGVKIEEVELENNKQYV